MSNIPSEQVTVLVVDDDQTIRELIVSDFESAGFSVFSAENGKKALTTIVAHPMKVVVSDLRMKGGSGLELLNEIEKLDIQKKPVFILITGFADISADEAYSKGVSGFVTKPFVRRALVNHANRLLMPLPERWESHSSPVKCDDSLKLEFKSIVEARMQGLLSLGTAGIFLALNPPFPKISQIIEIQLNFLEGSPAQLHATGQVRWVRVKNSRGLKSGAGFEFLSFNGNSLSEILRLQNEFPSQSFIPKM